MKQQNYTNHAQFVKGFHFILSALLLIGTISSLVNIWLQWAAQRDVMSAVLIALLFICGLFLFAFTRQFPLKAQDRAIRAEESLRYFVLTNKPINQKITMPQIIALRFAHDDEFITLADRAANESLSADDIKREIKNWRADHHRV